MSNIIKKIEKQTENISNKAKNKFKLEMKEIPRTIYILSCILWIISISTDEFFKDKLLYKYRIYKRNRACINRLKKMFKKDYLD